MAHSGEPHRIEGGDGPKWLKVEFWGLLPQGQSVVQVGPDEMAAVGTAFGFTRMTGPIATLSDPPCP